MRFFTFIIFAVLLLTGTVSSQAQSKSAANLVWADEFSGTGIPNTANWDRPEYNRRNNVSGPDGWWDQEDSYLDGNGNLVIRVRKVANRNSDSDPYDYSVGAVRTKNKFTQRYGKFEMRAQLPTQPGWWVAFWMMQGNVGSVANEGVDGSEVDIMEGWGWTNKINHAVHWDGYGDAHKSIGEKVEIAGLLDGYHIYTLEWYPDKYVFFIDGVETWRTTGGGVCNQPGYIKITGEISTESWAIGTNWSNNPEDAVYPDSFLIDYVRVYEFPEGRQPYSGLPANVPGRIEAEDYDHGANGEAYFDLSSGNNGKAYRVDDGDVQVCDEGGFNVGWTEDGEWMEYTVDIAGTGPYNLDLRSASTTGGQIQLEIDGEAKSEVHSTPLTSGSQTFETSTLENLMLERGEQAARLNIVQGGFNLNYLEFRQQDILFDLQGIEKKKSYEIGLPLSLEIDAWSIAGEISSLGFFLEGDSIGGAYDAGFAMSFTPGFDLAGWRIFRVSVFDDQGNHVSYDYSVFFGNLPPIIEFKELRNDTLVIGEENKLSVQISDPDGRVDSVRAFINARSFLFENIEEGLEFDVDTLSEGNYTLIVWAYDNSGNLAVDSLDFTMVLPPNILPQIEIVSPLDQAVLYAASANIARIDALDPDGSIVEVDLQVDGASIAERETEPLSYDISHLSNGKHQLTASVLDERGGTGHDTIALTVTDSLVIIGPWMLYCRNGSLAYATGLDGNAIEVCVEQTTGNITDVQLIHEIVYPILKNTSVYTAAFTASATKVSKITLALKDEAFTEDTLQTVTYDLFTAADSFVFEYNPEPDFENSLSFYLGYRKDVCVTIGDLKFDPLTSIREPGLENERFIFPNPVSETLFLNHDSDYLLYSLDGICICRGFNTKSIDVSALKKGLYILHTKEGMFKVIKL